jgi:hypothetical protein
MTRCLQAGYQIHYLADQQAIHFTKVIPHKIRQLSHNGKGRVSNATLKSIGPDGNNGGLIVCLLGHKRINLLFIDAIVFCHHFGRLFWWQ